MSRLTLPPESPRPLPTIAPFCLGFRNRGYMGGEQRWEAQPQVPFRIQGLLFWGAEKDTVITRCQLRLKMHVLASGEPVPARFFEAGLSFAELTQRLLTAEGEALALDPDVAFFTGWLTKNPDVKLRQLFEFDTLATGDSFTLCTRGHFDQLVAWGIGAR